MHLFKKEFYLYNGLRITMRPPRYPVKLGLHIKVNFGSEHELFVGSLLDTGNPRDDFVEYELPIGLLSQWHQTKRLLLPGIDDTFETAGLAFIAESEKELDKELIFDLKSIDMIGHP